MSDKDVTQLSAKIEALVYRIRSLPLLLLSVLASYRLTGRMFPLCVKIMDHRIRFKCFRHKDARVTVQGVIYVMPWLENCTKVVIYLGQGAEFRVDGDLLLGPNVRILVGGGATLSFGGKFHEPRSGFTENVIILCLKSIEIGRDFFGSWGLFITDADHHSYGDSNPPMPVIIGDHVWMCPEASVLKGASVGSDSVITAKSLVLKGEYPAGSLIGGIPAKKISNAKEWHL